MKYIAVLDYDHLDNGIFLTSVGRALAKQEDARAIVIHGDSEYTERLIQTGIMREQARIRCIKDLNHRLVALFADEGVATIGLNGYQKKCITLENNELKIDTSFFQKLPAQPVLLLSNLVLDTEKQRPVPVDLPDFLNFLNTAMEPDEIFLFSKDNRSKPGSPPPESREKIPDELKKVDFSARLITASAFGNLPKLEGSAKLEDLK